MKDFVKDTIDAHNTLRTQHGCPALQHSPELSQHAQAWAEQLAQKGKMMHQSQDEEGENIACMKGADLTGQKATQMWYDEIKFYSFSNPNFSSNTGHFTQMMWVDSVEIGVGRATAASGMQFLVARYFPPGNVIGRFKENVLAKGSKMVNRSDEALLVGPVVAQDNTSFKDEMLRFHNMYRAMHGVPPVKWSNSLEATARAAVERAAQTNTLKPLSGNFGQNMSVMSNRSLTGETVCELWYQESSSYNYNNPIFQSKTGSFTQMMWKNTKYIGAATASSGNRQCYVIALYDPPGNIRGDFPNNVPRPKEETTEKAPLKPPADQSPCCSVM